MKQFLVVWLFGSAVATAGLITVQLADKPLTPGLLASALTVTVSNTSDVAIVLRGVEWVDYCGDHRQWRARRYGSTRTAADGAIEHNMMTQSLTSEYFEDGLLFPGERLDVVAPLTPQRDGRHELRIRYAVAGSAIEWPVCMFLADSESPMKAVYRRAIAERIQARQGRAARDAILHWPGSKASPEQQEQFKLALPLASDPKNAATGGLSVAEAARKAKLDPERELYSAFYRAALSAWFFVRADRSAVALRWVLPPTAPPGYFKWKTYPMPNMDRTAPDEFGEKTAMLLRPDAFGDCVKVKLPSQPMYYEPGKTPLAAHELWRVLERACERSVDVRVVTINPNGLGAENVLTAGVVVDGAGRWLDPKPASPAGHYFASPKEAVEKITVFLQKNDWPALSRYYDLRDAAVAREELESGRFFLRTERPALVHPGLPWKYKQPFTPGFKFDRVEPTDAGDVVRVLLSIAIDEGGGMKQRGTDSFLLRKSTNGYQVLPK